jgi:Uma2 family endonuclease
MCMAVTTQVSVEEYLRTSYAPDCEYVDGEVLDRNVGELDHGSVQKAVLVYVAALEKKLGVFIIQEQRLQLNPRHYRVPDLMILAGGKPKEQIITGPPLVCTEVLSPEDRMSRMQKKIADYLAFGVRYVWVLEPKTKQAFSHTPGGMRLVEDGGALRTENPNIEIPLREIFD